MAVEQGEAPTVKSVIRSLNELEDHYGISTTTFLESEGKNICVDEDDAVDWLYLVEQLRVLESEMTA